MSSNERPTGSSGVLNNIISATLRLPVVLSYGVLIIVAIVLLGQARDNLQPLLLLLVAFVVLVSLVAYVYLDSRARQRLKSEEQVKNEILNTFNRKTYTVPVYKCYNEGWLERFRGTCEAYSLLIELQDSVEAHASDEFRTQFDSLKTEVDHYRDDLAHYLLIEKKSHKKDEHGDLIFDGNAKEDLEGHRCAIEMIVEGLKSTSNSEKFPNDS